MRQWKSRKVLSCYKPINAQQKRRENSAVQEEEVPLEIIQHMPIAVERLVLLCAIPSYKLY
eukprot:221572-Pelagomonas_calceolata.AAC.3